TSLVLVAIPEEMAVVEAQELHRAAVDELGMRPAALVLNQCHERRFTREQEAEILRLAAEGASGRLARGVGLRSALAAARRHLRRRKMTQFYEARLRRALPLPMVSLPYLFDEEVGPSSIERLARHLDRRRTFDALVEKHASSEAARRLILENRFYQQVSSALAGSHEYMAMEKLLELSADERFDLVVLDTPPTRHALDFLEAPDRL